jgi:cell division protein FtsA
MAEFIVAIELGSSKMTGIAGKKNSDGSITILAVATEDSTDCIRKGIVYNNDKTVQCLSNIINKMKNILKTDIRQVYVGVGGMSLHSVKNNIAKNSLVDSVVKQEMINELMDMNRGMTYPEYEILDAVTQEYKVDNQYQLEPVGIQCTKLEGNFLNILWRKSFYHNLTNCFENASIAIAEICPAPLALGDCVLTENEKRIGCVLVDLGAECTTVIVYFKNIIRHLVVIPIGSNNITKDLTSLQMDENEAEKMKLKYGSAFTECSDISDIDYNIDPQRKIRSADFIEIVEARMTEIIENVKYNIPEEYTDKLLGGIILTGGGSNMKNIECAFRNSIKKEKIRVAKFVNATINSNDPRITDHNGEMNTILGILLKGDMSCAGETFEDDLFGKSETSTANTKEENIHTPTTEELQKAEEEKRRKQEEEEEKARKQAETGNRGGNGNSISHKLWKKLKQFGQTMISEDE